MKKIWNIQKQANTDKPEMANSEVRKRKVFIQKLKRIKLLCDQEKGKNYRLEFYYLLTSRDYRNVCLDVLKNCHQKDIASLAREIMEFNIKRNILNDAPCLGDEVVLKLYFPGVRQEKSYLSFQ